MTFKKLIVLTWSFTNLIFYVIKCVNTYIAQFQNFWVHVFLKWFALMEISDLLKNNSGKTYNVVVRLLVRFWKMYPVVQYLEKVFSTWSLRSVFRYSLAPFRLHNSQTDFYYRFPLVFKCKALLKNRRNRRLILDI